MSEIGFVGLGTMGGRVALRLHEAGHTVRGYNRTAGRATWLEEKGVKLCPTPRQVAEAFLEYHALGVTTFLIRGFDPLEDAIDYGRELLPITRRLVAEQLARPAVAAE